AYRTCDPLVHLVSCFRSLLSHASITRFFHTILSHASLKGGDSMRLRCAAALVAWTLALAAAASAQTTVTFWHGYNDAETEALETRVIPLFEERHPGVEVEAVRLGYDDLRDRIVTSVVAGAGPDVVRIDLIWSPQFAAAGLSEPLDPLPGLRELRDNVYPGPLSTIV